MNLTASVRTHLARHPLTPELGLSLDSVRHGIKIPHEDEAALTEAGYVRRAIGGPMVTDLGRVRLLVP